MSAAPVSAAAPACDRAWFLDTFRTLAAGWYRALIGTSASCAVWQPPQGIVLPNFISRSGKQCDGVTRWLPALAAYAAQPDNPPVLTFDDGGQMDVRQVLHAALVHATDPDHPDFWQYARPAGWDQRQVESSLVAWALWLSRDWLPASLTSAQIANLQAWLASCTAFSDHFNNWALFTAVNHAARLALAEFGFVGDREAIRRDLIPGDEVNLADGWMWDNKYHGLDYYNFWVNGSHHIYLRRMLPDFRNPMLDRALDNFRLRQQDLPYCIDANGRNLLFGRSLSYRWAWLNGLVASHDLGVAAVPAGLTRAMLGRNLHAWLALGSLDAAGALRERLTGPGSDGVRSDYINCGHPYWGMQSFLCLQFARSHPFWQEPLAPLPCEQGDFLRPRQGPGLVFQSLHRGADVRVYNLRNLNYSRDTLYQKFVFSTAFPANVGEHHRTLGDNQLLLRLNDGTPLTPAEVLEVDTHDGRELHLILKFTAPAGDPAAGGNSFQATVSTTLRIVGDSYTTEHRIVANAFCPPGACWVEGGFVLPVVDQAQPTVAHADRTGAAQLAGHRVQTAILTGWEQLRLAVDGATADGFWRCPTPPQILTGHSRHFLLTAPARAAAWDQPQILSARHQAEVTA